MRRRLLLLCGALLAASAAKGGESNPAPPRSEAAALFEQARGLGAAGDLSDAAARGERALALWEATPRQRGPEIAGGLIFLGDVYRRMRAYARAEALLERGLAAARAALGPGHPEVATALTALGDVAFEKEQLDLARARYREGSALREAIVHRSGPAGADEATLRLADSYLRLGRVELARKRPADAKPLFERALVLQRHTVDPAESVKAAETLRQLALVAELQTQYGEAEELLGESLNLRLAAFDEEHPLVADSLFALGDYYFRAGEDDRANELLSRALAIDEAVWGKGSREVGAVLTALGRLRLAQHKESDAMPLFMRAFAISEAQLRRGVLGVSEADLESIIQGVEQDERHLFSLARAYPTSQFVQRLAVTAAVLFKGRSIEEATAISRALSRGLSPQQAAAFDRLRSVRAQVTRLTFGADPANEGRLKERLQALAEEREALETDLLHQLGPGNLRPELPDPFEITRKIAQALPKDGAFVQLVAYQDGPLGDESGPAKRARYQALVLRPDADAQAVDLGPAAPIDEAATRLHDALGRSDPGAQAAAHRLYDLAFRPLAPFLKARKIFLVPDGQLALVPFAALHNGTHYLVDAYDFVYLTSGTDLLPRSDAEDAYSSTVVVLAAPDFGGQAAASGATRAALERTFAWASLPGTEEEAKAIQSLIPEAQVYLHGEASKARLLGLYPPGVLHVATHGYFLEDAVASAGARTMVSLGGGGPKLPSTVEEPLLRSGLVMSAPSATAEVGDYLVSALELAGLNLWGTQLVVLSACDTGLGDVKLGQGVYGLRRALMVAGAETVVVSLWKVDDATTRALMERFYRNLLAGEGRAAALQKAMLALRDQHPHPHSWAPFITIGRDAPLRGLSRSEP